MIAQGRLKKMTSMLDRRPASSIAQKLIRHLSPVPTLCCIALINDVELLTAWEPVKNQHTFTILTRDCKMTTKKSVETVVRPCIEISRNHTTRKVCFGAILSTSIFGHGPNVRE